MSRTLEEISMIEEIQSYIAPIYRRYPRDMFLGALYWILNKPKRMKTKMKTTKTKEKVEKVMHEFKEGKLHSGFKKGAEVKNPKQAVAIALSEARKVGAKIPKQKKK